MKNVSILKAQKDEDFAYNLGGYLEDNFNGAVKLIDEKAAGEDKLENEFKDSDFVIALWSRESMEDTDFLLDSVHAERMQLEKRSVKCINVRFDDGIQIYHLKQEHRIITWTDKGDIPGLAKKIIDAITDPESKVTERIGNVSEGLVWNYFVVYLKGVLSGVHKGVKEWKEKNAGQLIANKYVLIIPASGKCPGKMSEGKGMDGVCETMGAKLTVVEVDDAGIQGRTFSPNVHRVRKDADSQEWFHFSGEFANPVNTIHMLEEEYKKIIPEEREELVLRFTQRLYYILSHKDNEAMIKDTFQIIQWDDMTPMAKPLNELIIDELSN